MSIKLYKQEIKDGLENKLKNTTVAFNCFLTKSSEPSETTVKAVAAFGEGRNFDLYYIQSILASVGPNKNDDWFLPEEIYAARSTPVHKQLNFMHDEKNIIGVITDSILLDAQGKSITSDLDISSIIDIATQAVIWTHWDDKKLENKISKIIASIEDNKLFVSMEALFKKFDYMLVKGTECKIVPRSEQTSFLTKYLRSYGGSGEYDGARIYRVLRDFTFSGKGIVDDPANPRSIIDESIFEDSKNKSDIELSVSLNLDSSELLSEVNELINKSVNKSVSNQMEKIMEDELKKEVAELKSALAKANDTIASFNKQEVEKVSAEVANLKEQVKALKALAEESQAKAEEMEKECAEKMEKMEKETCAKMDEKEKEAEAKVKEAEAKVAKFEAEKVEAQRISKLVAANVAQEKAAEVVKTFASVNDEMFDQIAALYAQKTVAKTETIETTSVSEVVDAAKAATKTEDVKIDKVEESEDKLTALSKSIASKLSFINKKGNK